MNKGEIPEGIPAEVWAKAAKETAWLRDSEQEFGEMDYRTITLIIARAILAETERCAKIVTSSVTQSDSEAVAARCSNLAAAIRSLP